MNPPTASPAPAPAAPANKPSFWRAHRWPILAALIILSASGVLAARWWLGPQHTTITVLRRDFVQTVVASGQLQSPHRIDIATQITGTVQRIPVLEGQRVRAGDLLLQLDATELIATGRQADLAVDQARAKLRQLQELQGPVAAQALRQAQISLNHATLALARSQALFDQGFIGQAALNEVEKTVALADAEQHAKQQQRDTTTISGSDWALAAANLAGAKANADAAHARVGYAAITAAAAGTLIHRQIEVGAVVQPGRTLMTLSPDGPTQLVADLDEKNLALLAVGQAALASADAYPDQRFNAKLTTINPAVNPSTGTVQIKLDVSEPPAPLKQDMTVSIDIVVARRPQALLIPLSALRTVDATSWVLRLQGRYARRQPVQIGLRTNGWAEVLAGLSEGDVLLQEVGAVQPNARVQAIAATPPQ